MATEFSHFDDAEASRSPPLEPVISQRWHSPPTFSLSSFPRRSRSPSPWDIAPANPSCPPSDRSASHQKSRRPRAVPDPGDTVLIDFMGGLNHPDVAKQAGEEYLHQSDDSDSEELEGVVKAQYVSYEDPLGPSKAYRQRGASVEDLRPTRRTKETTNPNALLVQESVNTMSQYLILMLELVGLPRVDHDHLRPT